MRDRHVRSVFLGLIVSLPLLILAVAPGRPGLSGRSPSAVSSGWGAGSLRVAPALPVYAIETVVILGLVFVERQRRRLLRARGSEPHQADSLPAPHLTEIRPTSL